MGWIFGILALIAAVYCFVLYNRSMRLRRQLWQLAVLLVVDDNVRYEVKIQMVNLLNEIHTDNEFTLLFATWTPLEGYTEAWGSGALMQDAAMACKRLKMGHAI